MNETKDDLKREKVRIVPISNIEDLPEDFECPLCGVGKDNFSEAE